MSTHAWSSPSAAERLKILQGTRTVAIVGASDIPARASYFVATHLLSSSPYRVWFVNPRVESILGQRVYPCLADLPESPDLVDVFRKPSDLPQVLGHARDAGAATDTPVTEQFSRKQSGQSISTATRANPFPGDPSAGRSSTATHRTRACRGTPPPAALGPAAVQVALLTQRDRPRERRRRGGPAPARCTATIPVTTGGEFIIHALIGWCAERAIFMTRPRAHTCNDNAHVEQKNGDIVRRSAFRYRGCASCGGWSTCARTCSCPRRRPTAGAPPRPDATPAPTTSPRPPTSGCVTKPASSPRRPSTSSRPRTRRPTPPS